MSLTFSISNQEIDTRNGGLGALLSIYRTNQVLNELENVPIQMKKRIFSPGVKLCQVLVSMLAGCETVSEVNERLGHRQDLAQLAGWSHFADQSALSRTLDRLTQKQIDEIQQVGRQIWWRRSRIRQRDWRRHLTLDFDLSGLPSSRHAEKSEKGYFSGKKTQRDANWPG